MLAAGNRLVFEKYSGGSGIPGTARAAVAVTSNAATETASPRIIRFKLFIETNRLGNERPTDFTQLFQILNGNASPGLRTLQGAAVPPKHPHVMG